MNEWNILNIFIHNIDLKYHSMIAHHPIYQCLMQLCLTPVLEGVHGFFFIHLFKHIHLTLSLEGNDSSVLYTGPPGLMLGTPGLM